MRHLFEVKMKKLILMIICMSLITSVGTWYFFNNTRIGVGDSVKYFL